MGLRISESISSVLFPIWAKLTARLIELIVLPLLAVGLETTNTGHLSPCWVNIRFVLIELYASKRSIQKMPVKINGADFTFSPGKHNQLQKAIIEEFAPRFAPNAECLYIGDTIEKDLVKNEAKLWELGFSITLHDKMPDVVLYSEERNWLYFIEAVTSVGPMDQRNW